nr:helix-turn-helix domain-containing protein [Halorhodospira halochloris]
MTLGEARLIEFLLRARGRPVNRDQLAEAVARSREGNPKSVDVLVSRLRRKLEDKTRGLRHIVAVPGLGYRIEVGE